MDKTQNDDSGSQQPPAHRRGLGCLTNTHHIWKSYSTDDGGRYRACERCGKEYVNTGRTPMVGG